MLTIFILLFNGMSNYFYNYIVWNRLQSLSPYSREENSSWSSSATSEAPADGPFEASYFMDDLFLKNELK